MAAILNITPNHLDRHPNMTAYVQAKLNLLSNLPPNATVVLSLDDPVVSQLSVPGAQATHRRLPREWRLGDLLPAARTALTADKTKVVCFSTHASLAAGACLVDDHLFYAGQPICHRSEVKLRGEHNLGNLLAAAAISGAAGASLAAMNKVASTFAGVPHRLEVVAQAGGVTWINDSIATSPERALAGLRSFERGEQTLTLLAGGKDKNLLWDSLADEVLNRVDYLIGFGQVGPMFVNLVQQRGEYTDLNAPNCAVVQRLDEAVELAARAATPGTVVLLSPGGTSYDAYKDFEERGAHFRQLVAKYVNENWQSGSQLEKTGKSTH